MRAHDLFPNGKTLMFYLGADAADAAREQAEADQRAVEYAEMVARQAPVVDATDIDE